VEKLDELGGITEVYLDETITKWKAANSIRGRVGPDLYLEQDPEREKINPGANALLIRECLNRSRLRTEQR